MKLVQMPLKYKKSIDWDKPQWMQNINNPNLIVLLHKDYNEDSFSGTALPYSECPNGEYFQKWAKSMFKLLTNDVPFIISNKD